MSVPAGGASTINGIIYQIMWSLLEASTIQVKAFDADANGKNATQALVVLEPNGGGGDILVCDSDTTTVQQLKAKSGGGAWSLRSIVFDVLPDLYRSVEIDQKQQFEFITEGHQGDWTEVSSFFGELASRPFPGETDNVLTMLSSTRMLQFRGSLRKEEKEKIQPSGIVEEDENRMTELSEFELFKCIASILREKAPAKKEPENLTHRKLWKLLSHLRFRWDESAEKLKSQLLRRLRAVVDNTDKLEDMLHTLLMALAEKASKGQAPIEAVPFFRDHGLDATPLTKWYLVVRASSKLLETTLSSLHYHIEQDVRPLPVITDLAFWKPPTSPFLVLTGESGQGKTWRLCALARIVSATNPVVLFRTTGDGIRDVEKAARLFWQNKPSAG